MELEALQKLDELLNQAPQAQTPPPRQVPREEPTPRVINPVDMPTPRVDATIPHKKAKEMSQERAKNVPPYMRSNKQQSQNTLKT